MSIYGTKSEIKSSDRMASSMEGFLNVLMSIFTKTKKAI